MEQHPTDFRPVSVLSIAGSDSGGGAGIQADLKTFAAHRVHGLTAIAALTAQNTRGVSAVHVPPLDFLRAQIDVLFDDFRIGAVKLGMLANAQVVETVADALIAHEVRNLVLDPVMVATSGARLLEADAIRAIRERLFPLTRVLTPNLHEAELLVGHPIQSLEQMQQAAHELRTHDAMAVLMKGGHRPTDDVVDVLLDGAQLHSFTRPRLDVDGHGTGCTLSAAIAANLALGHDIKSACEAAGDYVFGALEHAIRPGSSQVSVLGHGWQGR
ncbi:bifunctional hydroxymethylpyrimidine kinase/phosphomethylpyrimidine kinase [Denitratimonas sp. CY0512]|uniref:bifunctional hydroxymethylpyrimidine kinase/phosphomethylpyrimidine kinase n=1 Tax=Denitratimonas sp. CY0512 TaxID=3131940 RepID=UPI0030B7C543